LASFLETGGREGEGHVMCKFLEQTGWEVGEKMSGNRGTKPMVSIAFLQAELARLKLPERLFQECLLISDIQSLISKFEFPRTLVIYIKVTELQERDFPGIDLLISGM
jgi:hypothetical protein